MTNEESIQWNKFLDALENIQKINDFNERKSFFETFKSELVLLSAWLHEAKITGGMPNIVINPDINCNFCNANLIDTKYFVDGQIKDTRWSYMCLPCFGQHGIGISWGLGQLYKLRGVSQDGDAMWVCIAGGDPNIDLPQHFDLALF